MGRPRARGLLCRLVVGLGLLALARPAEAHPAGFTSINRYIGVECDGRGRVHLDYLLDFAELPSYAEFQQLDADHDGTVTPDEQRAYLQRRLPPLVAAWTVEINGARASLHVAGSNLEALEGERGMQTLRIAAEIEAEPGSPPDSNSSDGEIRVHVRDTGFSDRSGWRELAAQPSPGVEVTDGITERSSDALAYRRSESPPRVDDARMVFRLVRAAPIAPRAPRPPRPPVVVDARLASLAAAMKRASGSWSFSLAAFALAGLLGAVHALSPGHGKALAAAYLVGRRARPSQALVFGATVSLAHTFVVFVLGGLAVTIERTVGSDRLMRGLEVASALTVLVLGLWQLPRRWREFIASGQSHDHSGDHGHFREVGSILALGASSGLTPCPSAIAVLLTAIALRRCGFGVVLVFAFSLGVAVTLTTAGLLVLLARRVLDRWAGAALYVRWLPVASSAGVLAIGVLLCASALSPAP